MHLNIWQAVSLAVIFIIALYSVRDPGMAAVAPPRPGPEDLTFDEARTVEVLTAHAAAARKDRYRGRHRTQPPGVLGQAEYRRQLAGIGGGDQESVPSWLAPLYKPWNPGW